MKKTPFVTKQQVEEIVKQFPTPFHLYDEAGIRANAQAVKDAFAWNPGFREYFAVKATPNPYLLKILKDYDMGCDCSSYTELMLAKSCGFDGEHIMFSSNDTPAEEFAYADKLGAWFISRIRHQTIYRLSAPVYIRCTMRFWYRQEWAMWLFTQRWDVL